MQCRKIQLLRTTGVFWLYTVCFVKKKKKRIKRFFFVKCMWCVCVRVCAGLGAGGYGGPGLGLTAGLEAGLGAGLTSEAKPAKYGKNCRDFNYSWVIWLKYYILVFKGCFYNTQYVSQYRFANKLPVLNKKTVQKRFVQWYFYLTSTKIS